MSMQTTLTRAARGAMLAISRGTFVKADDSRKMQEVTLEVMVGEKVQAVEHWHPYGYTHVALAPDKDNQPEAIVLYLGGNRSHPIVLSIADRRYRPKNLKPGESAHHDDQKQQSKIGRDGIETTGKTVQITGGGDNPKGDTSGHELNEFAKGAVAELAQLKHHVAGLHYEASRMREIIQPFVPGLAVLAPILNKQPTGLDAMAADVQTLLTDYAQKQVQQALGKFLDPSLLLGLTSVLSAGLEASIASLKANIASLLSANPVVRQVDDLKDELAALTASGGDPGPIQEGTKRLQAQIDALTGANPVVGQIANLRNTLQGLIDTAGPGLNFLAVQQRAAQGLIRSVKFGP